MKFNNHIWFLDHLGINHQIKYIGKWEKKDYLLYQTILKNKLDEYCYQNGFEKHMIKNIKPIRFWWKGDSMNIIFEGSFFKDRVLKKNIDQIKKQHAALMEQIFFNHKSKYSDKVQLKKGKIYRLDIACNTKWKELDRINIKGRSNKLKKYYENPDKRKAVTGIQYGNRGRDYTHLRIYNKQFDPNKFHDYIRFGHCEFVRMEFELGSRPIKNYGMRTLDSITLTNYKKDLNNKFYNYDKFKWEYNSPIMNNWESLLRRCFNTAHPITDHDNIKKIKKYDALPNFTYEKEEKYYYKEQVKGIIWNHFKDEDYKWLRQNVNI